MYNNKISNYNYTNCTRIYYNNTNRIMSSELNQSTYNLSQYFYLLNQHLDLTTTVFIMILGLLYPFIILTS